MDDDSFTILLQRIAPTIRTQDTVLRKAIPPEERLSLTLRYLATGTHKHTSLITWCLRNHTSVASGLLQISEDFLLVVFQQAVLELTRIY